ASRSRISRSRWRQSRPLASLISRASSCSAIAVLDGREASRVEHLELGRLFAEDGAGDQVATGEPEHVAVAGVATRDPDALTARHGPDQRLEVGRGAPDA